MRHSWVGLVLFGSLFTGRLAPADETLPIEKLTALKSATVFLKVERLGSSSRGSGFVIKVDADTAYVVTNHHVIDPSRPGRAPTITAVFGSGTTNEESLPAEVLAAEPRRDLAVLRVRGLRNKPTPIDLSTAAKQVETTPVYIFGFPLGELLSTDKGNPAITVGKGSISSIRLDTARKVASIQVAGDVTPGNSGGPIVDADGRLVGIAVATVRDRQIGFAVPREHLTVLLQGHLVDFSFTHKTTTPGMREVTVELGLFDPFQKLRSTNFYYLRQDKAEGKKLADLTGVEKVELRREQQNLVGKFTLAVADGKEAPIVFQTISVNGEGTTHLSNPRVQVFRSTDTGVPPIGPIVKPDTPLDKDTLARLLMDLQSTDRFRCRSAAEQLSRAVVGEGKADVVKALEPLLADKDMFARNACIKAYVVWAAKDAAPKLYELVKHENFVTRRVALEELAKLEGARAAVTIAGMLPDLTNRRQAADALRQMGPDAEKAVQPYVAHQDVHVKSEACKILEAIGTTASLDALNKAAAEPRLAQAARSAIEAINARGMKK